MKIESAPSSSEQQMLSETPKLFVFVYLLHLAVPVFLVVDVLSAWRNGDVVLGQWNTDTFVLGFSTLWVLAALAILAVGSRDWRRFTRRFSGPLTTIYVVYIMMAVAEIATRTVFPQPPVPGQLRPGHTQFGPLDPVAFPGLSGTKSFTINKLGFRGPLPPARGSAYRILAIGGSTTICTYLDDSEEWPHVLMGKMNAARPDAPVWVGNAGVSGRTAVSHLVLLQSALGVADFDMAVFLVGVNDLYATLAFEGAPTQAILERADGYQGDLPVGKRFRSLYPSYRRLEIFQLFHGLAGILQRRFGSAGRDDRADQLPAPARPSDLDVVPYRKARAMGPLVPLPDLRVGLEEYGHRIFALQSLCRTLGIRCLFLTQPSIWRADLSAADQNLLWNGRVGRWEHPKGFASSGDLDKAMDAYNQVLLKVCQENQMECYDLAARIPKDTTAFYDDVHFNAGGAQMVAENLKQYLLAKPPLGKPDGAR